MHTEPGPSLRVTVRLFASLRELAGTQEEQFELPAGSRAADAWDACTRRWPALATRRRSTVVAINREFARPDAVLYDGDEVALLPPVSGGSGSTGGRRMDEIA